MNAAAATPDFLRFRAPDWRTALGELSDRAQLAYVRLFIETATRGRPLLDDKRLADVTHTGRAWGLVRDELVRMGRAVLDAGYLLLPLCEDELERSRIRTGAQSRNGKAGAEARWSKRGDKGEDMGGHKSPEKRSHSNENNGQGMAEPLASKTETRDSHPTGGAAGAAPGDEESLFAGFEGWNGRDRPNLDRWRDEPAPPPAPPPQEPPPAGPPVLTVLENSDPPSEVQLAEKAVLAAFDRLGLTKTGGRAGDSRYGLLRKLAGRLTGGLPELFLVLSKVKRSPDGQPAAWITRCVERHLDGTSQRPGAGRNVHQF